MAQGKNKIKSNLPTKSKIIKKKVNKKKATAKRPNAPVKSKKVGVEKTNMKAKVTKMVNAAAEKQLRSLATNTPQLSVAQKRAAAAPTAPSTSKK